MTAAKKLIKQSIKLFTFTAEKQKPQRIGHFSFAGERPAKENLVSAPAHWAEGLRDSGESASLRFSINQVPLSDLSISKESMSFMDEWAVKWVEKKWSILRSH